MKALVLTSFGKLEVHERSRSVPASDEVVIEVVATGICGSDIHGFTGENGRRQIGQVMGHETVGRIWALGAALGRRDLRVGDVVTFNPVVRPVVADGVDDYRGREQHDPEKYVVGVRPDVSAAFAEFVTVPARNVTVLPTAMPIVYGALIEPLAVAVHAVRRSGAKLDDVVVVLGGGPIGQSVVLALKMIGIERIVVSELSEERRDLVERLGASAVDPSVEAVETAVRRLFKRPADVAIDAVGVTQTLAAAFASTRLGATICLVGMGSRQLEFDAFLVSTEERCIVGSFTYSNDDFSAAADWVGSSPDALDRLISRIVPLEEAEANFAALAAGDGTPGKVLVWLAQGDAPQLQWPG